MLLAAAPAWAVKAKVAPIRVRTVPVQAAVGAVDAWTPTLINGNVSLSPLSLRPLSQPLVPKGIEGIGVIEGAGAAAVAAPALVPAENSNILEAIPTGKQEDGKPVLKLLESKTKDWSGEDLADLDPLELSDRLEAVFDGGEAAGGLLQPGWGKPFGTAETQHYGDALLAASNGGETEEAVLVDAGAELFASAGILVRRKTFEIGMKSFAGFEVVPQRGGSKLNDIAFRMKKVLGASMDYVPGRTGGASAMFNSEERRLYLPSPGDVDAYPALLHEARHAFYSSLIRGGKTRLFHVSILAVGRHVVAPNALSYTKYISLEELTTFPKTLRHLVMLARKEKNPGTRALLLAKLKTRLWQYHDVLESAGYNMRSVIGWRDSGKLEAMPLEEDSVRARDLGGAPPGGKLYAVRVPRSLIYFPVESEAKPSWRQRLFGRSDREALDVLNLRVELIRGLVAQANPIVLEFINLFDEENLRLASMQMLTNRLVVHTQTADRAFVKRYQDYRARGK